MDGVGSCAKVLDAKVGEMTQSSQPAAPKRGAGHSPTLEYFLLRISAAEA